MLRDWHLSEVIFGQFNYEATYTVMDLCMLLKFMALVKTVVENWISWWLVLFLWLSCTSNSLVTALREKIICVPLPALHIDTVFILSVLLVFLFNTHLLVALAIIVQI